MFPFGEIVVRRRPVVTVDGYGDERLTWPDPPNDTDIDRVAVALTGSAEDWLPERTTIDSDYTLYMAVGTDVATTDRVIIRGDVCEVVGDPFAWRQPMTGWAAGLVVTCKIVKG